MFIIFVHEINKIIRYDFASCFGTFASNIYALSYLFNKSIYKDFTNQRLTLHNMNIPTGCNTQFMGTGLFFVNQNIKIFAYAYNAANFVYSN